MEDRCIFCGEIIPEGRMVCLDCEFALTGKINGYEECTSIDTITPNRIIILINSPTIIQYKMIRSDFFEN